MNNNLVKRIVSIKEKYSTKFLILQPAKIQYLSLISYISIAKNDKKLITIIQKNVIFA